MHDVAHYLGVPTNNQSLIRAVSVDADPPMTHYGLWDMSFLPENITVVLKQTRVGGL